MGLLQRPLGKKHILCSLLQRWPHPGRLHLLMYLKPAAACQRQLSVRAGFACVFRFQSIRLISARSLLSVSCEQQSAGCFVVWLVNTVPGLSEGISGLEHSRLISFQALRIVFLIKPRREFQADKGVLLYVPRRRDTLALLQFSLCVQPPAQAAYTITGVCMWVSAGLWQQELHNHLSWVRCEVVTTLVSENRRIYAM